MSKLSGIYPQPFSELIAAGACAYVRVEVDENTVYEAFAAPRTPRTTAGWLCSKTTTVTAEDGTVTTVVLWSESDRSIGADLENLPSIQYA
jgi:hypothetical protein